MNKHSPTKISPGGQTRFRRQRHPLELLQGTAFGLRRGAAQRRGELLRRGPVAPFFLGTFGTPLGHLWGACWKCGNKRENGGKMLDIYGELGEKCWKNDAHCGENLDKTWHFPVENWVTLAKNAGFARRLQEKDGNIWKFVWGVDDGNVNDDGWKLMKRKRNDGVSQRMENTAANSSRNIGFSSKKVWNQSKKVHPRNVKWHQKWSSYIVCKTKTGWFPSE